MRESQRATLAEYPDGQPRARFLTGRTAWTTGRSDPRYPYCLYVPVSYSGHGAQPSLIVVVHGTERAAEHYRDTFGDFCEMNNCAVLAPLFPVRIDDPGSVDGYKFIEYQGTRFDLLLLEMVEEVTERWCLSPGLFYLFGFSGGGQFAHRFLYLHPERLAAVAIGAPGQITRPDGDSPWPAGWAGMRSRFGITPSVSAIRRVPAQLIVGENDTDRTGLAVVENRAVEQTPTRVERIQVLHEDFDLLGLDTELRIVPGVDHDGFGVLPTVQDFLVRRLREGRRPTG